MTNDKILDLNILAPSTFTQNVTNPNPNITNASPPSTGATLGNQSLQEDAEDELEEEFLDYSVNFRHLGGVGECRHDFHCIGSEACVNFKGNYM